MGKCFFRRLQEMHSVESRDKLIMRTVMENHTLTIFLEGRIDSQNAAESEKIIFEAVGPSSDADVVVDAENLAYISSAGLRVLMKLRKQCGHKIPVMISECLRLCVFRGWAIHILL